MMDTPDANAITGQKSMSTQTVFVTPKQAAKELGIPYTWLSSLIASGEVPALETPRRNLVSVQQVAEALKQRARQPRHRITKAEAPPLRYDALERERTAVRAYVDRAWQMLPSKARVDKPALTDQFAYALSKGAQPGAVLNEMDQAYNRNGETRPPGIWLRSRIDGDSG